MNGVVKRMNGEKRILERKENKPLEKKAYLLLLTKTNNEVCFISNLHIYYLLYTYISIFFAVQKHQVQNINFNEEGKNVLYFLM